MHAAWETRLAYSPAGDEFLTSRRLLRRAPPLVRGTAWLLRQVTGIDIPPLDAGHNTQQVHHDDDHDHRRCYSKFSIVLDLILNLVFVVVGVAMLGVSGKEDPPVPLRLWACGYVVSCVVHIVCVVVRRNEELGFGGFENWGRIEEHIRGVVENACPVKFMASLVWWVAGFWWVIPPIALPDAPRLYWLCAAFLLCDIMAILVALAATCLYFLSVCCCMPCMLAILPALTDTEYSPEIKFATVAYLFHTSTLVNEAGISNSDRKRQANTLNNLLDGATEEEINSLPKFKFRRIDDFEIVNSQLEESSGGAEAECDAIAPNERVISQDHECGICLEAYQNGEELRQLPCHHQFHSACIDTWLRKRTICPMCKFDMLKPTYGRYGGTMV